MCVMLKNNDRMLRWVSFVIIRDNFCVGCISWIFLCVKLIYSRTNIPAFIGLFLSRSSHVPLKSPPNICSEFFFFLIFIGCINIPINSYAFFCSYSNSNGSVIFTFILINNFLFNCFIINYCKWSMIISIACYCLSQWKDQFLYEEIYSYLFYEDLAASLVCHYHF